MPPPTPNPVPQSYASFLRTARNLARTSEESYFRFMRLLVVMEKQDVLWRRNHETWDDVLRVEKLCTPSKFHAFKKACEQKLDVERIGVDAACLLSRKSATVRQAVLRETTEWIQEHDLPPTYQLITTFVKSHIPKDPKSVGTPYAKAKAEGGQLRAENELLRAERALLRTYIRRLQTLLRSHHIAYPKR